MTDITIAQKMLDLKKSAEARKLEFSLSFRHVKKLMTTKYCFYTNNKFENNSNDKDLKRTIDRIDASKGYTDLNTVACCESFNNRKANLTLNDMINMFNVLSNKLNIHSLDKSK